MSEKFILSSMRLPERIRRDLKYVSYREDSNMTEAVIRAVDHYIKTKYPNKKKGGSK